MKIGSIYLIKNNIDGKIYVGQTFKTVKYRWSRHILTMKGGDTRPLYNAIRKYGSENFKVEIIGNASNQHELDNLEQFWIFYLNTRNKKIGYNLHVGGNAMSGVNHPLWGKRHTEETIRNMQKPKSSTKNMFGPKSETHKQNMRKPKSEEHKKNMYRTMARGNKGWITTQSKKLGISKEEVERLYKEGKI